MASLSYIAWQQGRSATQGGMQEYKIELQHEIAEHLESNGGILMTDSGVRATQLDKWCRNFKSLFNPCSRSCTRIPCGIIDTDLELRCRPTAAAMEDEDP